MPHKRIYYNGEVVSVPISPYEYKPLIQTENEFRLVELQPSHSDYIKASLRHYSLLDPPRYTALSYEWGDPRKFKLIEVDHFLVPIPNNLDVALRQLRSHGCELIWVDNLCIDQHNEEEKNSQVIRMAAIYQEASTVAASLGPEEHGSARVMQMLRRMRDCRSERPQQSVLPKTSYLQSLHTELKEFLKRHYWTRVWIIQEIVAGVRVRLFCGDLDAEWDDLYVVVMKLLPEDWWRDHTLIPVRRLCESRLNRIEGKAVGLLEQLCNTRSSTTSDPRDRVFAILGLCFDRANYISEVKYGWFETDLCKRMTRSAISKRCLDIISIGPARSGRQSDYDLPSWCPDYLNFPSEKQPWHLAKYLSGQDERFRVGRLCRRWNATNMGTSVPQTYFTNGNTLQVKGYRIGKVHDLASILGENATPWQMAVSRSRCSNHEIFEALSRMLSLYSEEYAKHIDSPFLLNLLFEFDANLDDYKNLPEYFDTVKKWRDLNQNFMILGKTLKQRCTEWNAEWFKLHKTNADVIQPHLPRSHTHLTHHAIAFKGRSLKDPTRALTALADLIKERLRLMTTSEEQVGWAHHNAQLGDEIFLLEGCNMPILLRRKERQHAYVVVGHAYVDEVMDGEVWRTLEPQQLDYLHIC